MSLIHAANFKGHNPFRNRHSQCSIIAQRMCTSWAGKVRIYRIYWVQNKRIQNKSDIDTTKEMETTMNSVYCDSKPRCNEVQECTFFRAIIKFISKPPKKVDQLVAVISPEVSLHKAEFDRSILPSTYIAA